MGDLQEQLAALRRRIASIDRKYQTLSRAPAPPPSAPPVNVEEWCSGQVVATSDGEHFESERLWERHRLHGAVDIAALEDLREDLLEPLSDDKPLRAPASRWAFLDTETTGLAGGTGTCAFLVGVGRITKSGFAVRQFFMRDHGEEASMLHALREHLGEFDILVTYNGKAFDQPLLETRYRMHRSRSPFSALRHVDLLFGARRLWKLRLDSCRLVELERQILGFERQGDIDGALIPYIYFEYLRTRSSLRLAPVFLHNALDIVTLACLAGIVPGAHQSPEQWGLQKGAHGAELVGLGRWLWKAQRLEDALRMFRMAIERGLPDELLFRTLWDMARLERTLSRPEAALALFSELAQCRNPHRAAALEELAKYYEHEEKNYAMALEFVRMALGYGESTALRKREQRLQRRLVTPRPRRLL